MIIENEEEMQAIGQKLATKLAHGDVVCLSGQLGVGKSVLARAIIRMIANDDRLEVPSPSFTLVQDYVFDQKNVMHMDAYRLSNSDELWELGLPQCFDGQVTLVEWPERLGELTPSRRLDIEIQDLGENRRDVILNYHGDWTWKI